MRHCLTEEWADTSTVESFLESLALSVFTRFSPRRIEFFRTPRGERNMSDSRKRETRQRNERMQGPEPPEEQEGIHIKPFRLLTVLAGALLVGEASVMFILSALPPLPTAIEAFVDAIMLTILVSPALYFFSFRPLIRHIREHGRIENELRRIRAAVDDASEAVLIVNNDQKPVYFNVAFGHLFGCKPGEMAEKKIDFLFVDREFARDIIAGIQRGASWQGETQMVSSKQSDFIAFLRATPIMDEEFNVIGTLFVCTDITKQKQAEEERLRREKLQGVIEMAGAACHELNQPMQVVSGYSELLLSQLSAGKPPDQLIKHLREIRRQISRMADITGKLNNITSYETQEYVAGARIIDIDKASK